jgi:hypothetical protein
MIVLFWSRATRDLLESFGWGIAAEVLALEVEERAGHVEEGEAGAVIHLEEGMERGL